MLTEIVPFKRQRALPRSLAHYTTIVNACPYLPLARPNAISQKIP